MYNRRHYHHCRIEQEKFEEQIRTAILKCSDEKETVSLEEIERWVEEDRKKRRLKNRIIRFVSFIIKKGGNI